MRSALDLLLIALGSLGAVVGCDLTNDISSTCGTLNACGGDLDGTWVVEDTCSETDLEAEANAEFELPADCGDVVRSVTVELAGTMTFDSGTETGELTTTIVKDYFYSADCIAALGSEASAAVCASLRDGVVEGNMQSAECEYVRSGCSCNTTYEDQVTLAETYSVSDGTIRFGQDDSTADYCVVGDTLTMRNEEADPPGVVTLRRTD